MLEVLLVRFDKPQRAFIRKYAKKNKISEAALVRSAVNDLKAAVFPLKDYKEHPRTKLSATS